MMERCLACPLALQVNSKWGVGMATDDVRNLRAQAHGLQPVVRIGSKGLTQAVHDEVEVALDAHELIKIKIVADRDERAAIVPKLCEVHGAVLVQTIGQICVLYRKNDE